MSLSGTFLCSRTQEEENGPGNKWKSGIPAPNPAPTMHPGPRGPAGKGGPGPRDQEKGEERQSFQPPGSGMLCLCGGGGQAYLGSHHSWGARGAGLPLEALREKEERLVGTRSLAWTRHGPQAPGSPPSPWLRSELNWDGGHSTRRPFLGGLPDRTGGRGVCGRRGATHHFSSLAWVSRQPVLSGGALEGVQRSGEL